MSRRILIVQGHPDSRPERLCRALTDAYADGALEAGHQVRRISVAGLGLAPLTSREEWEGDAVPAAARVCQDDISWAEHLVIIYPLWLGDMPALLKAFFEQVFRPGFAMPPANGGSPMAKLLTGRSARVVVTMGMPAPLYWIYYGGHGLRALRRSLLGFVGISPMRFTVIGLVEAGGASRHQTWLKRLRGMGRAAR
jgi:putative NADPH-quinone reductase